MPKDRILVIKLSAFGDVVQAAGAIRDIRNHHPDDELIVMTTPAFREIMEKCPWADSVFIDARDSRWRLDKMAALRRRLQKLQVAAVYDLQQVGRTAFYHRFLLPSPRWIIGGCVRERKTRAYPEEMGAMDRFAAQLNEIGIEAEHTLAPDLSWMTVDISHILATHAVRRPYVVLIPGSSAVHEKKRWPYYNELAAWFRNRGMLPVTVPGPEELELCRSLSQATMLTEGKPFLSLFELAGILKHADFIVGNDTGPTHLAAHLGRPGLALFSGHFPPSRTGIQYSRFNWFETENLGDLSLQKVQAKAAAMLSGDVSG